MSNKRRILIFVLGLSIIFFTSYYLTANRVKNANVKKNNTTIVVDSSQEDRQTIQYYKNEELVAPNSKVTFNIKYKKSGETLLENIKEVPNELLGKRKKEVEEYYIKYGYNLKSMQPNEIVLEKTVDKYSPNKYVLGIKDDYIAIYKTDSNGDAFIENPRDDITEIRVKKEGDRELFTYGDNTLQFNTRDDAEAHLEDYR